MAQSNLRKFRHEIAVLKHKGLVSNVDARGVKPNKRLLGLIDRFDDFLSGKATPVKVSKSELQNLKAAGYDTYKGKVLYPHSVGEKVGVSHGRAKVRNPNGVEHVTIPVQYHQLPKYLQDLKKNHAALDAMKRKDEYFAFRFYGHQSIAIYRNIDLLIEDFERYQAIEEARNSKSAKDMNEIYRNLEIVKVHRSRDWKAEAARIRTERGTYSTAGYRKAKKKRERGPAWKRAEYNAKQSDKVQRWRDSMSAAEREAYNKAGAKRAKKSRRKHATKSKTKKKTRGT